MIIFYQELYFCIKSKPIVAFSFLGNNLDLPTTPDRWQKWRPTVSLGQFPDLLIDRIELLTQPQFDKLSKTVVEDLAGVAPETQVRTHQVAIKDPWNFEEIFQCLYEFSRGYTFKPDEEDYLINITTGTHVTQICLFLLTESRHLPGRLLQLSPPKRTNQHGINPGNFNIIDLDLSRYDQIVTRFGKEAEEATNFLKSGIATKNKQFNHLIKRIEQVAVRSTAPLLLTGPTGAGKSRLARRIFELKKQRNQVSGEFVEINCSTLRGDAAMSTLFGHKKGAYTGAITARSGLLKTANQGVLFLDEIGELGLDEQSMLLRALEEKRFLPVGADCETYSDFQLISGTNRNLNHQVGKGSFRADLLARLNLWHFDLPGLKDRREDIEPNIQYELDLSARDTGNKVSFNKEGYQTFLTFALEPASQWKGNFRDLNAAITRMSTLAGNRRIGKQLVNEEIDRLHHQWNESGNAPHQSSKEILKRYLDPDQISEIDRFDIVQLAEVIRVCSESISLSEAGRTLFAASRKKRKATNDSDRVRKYLAKFGLDWDRLND